MLLGHWILPRRERLFREETRHSPDDPIRGCFSSIEKRDSSFQTQHQRLPRFFALPPLCYDRTHSQWRRNVNLLPFRSILVLVTDNDTNLQSRQGPLLRIDSLVAHSAPHETLFLVSRQGSTYSGKGQNRIQIAPD